MIAIMTRMLRGVHALRRGGVVSPAARSWSQPLAIVMMAAVALMSGCDAASAAERDWSGIQLAWLGDPRAAADVPAGVEPVPTRRPSRRAQRRAARRGMSFEEHGVADGATEDGRGSSPAGGPRQPLGVSTTLGSPFSAGEETTRPTIHRDQPYGSQGHPRQKFDLYLPPGCSGGGMPLVIWIHGDDWRSGSKSPCPITWLADKGYAVASIGYRLTDTAAFPAQLDDCRAAIVTISRDAELWGIDRERICVVGQAAGGHLAALVAFATSDAGEHSAADIVAAVCAIGAPTHLTSLGAAHDRASSPASQLVGGPLPEFREAAQRASPLEHVSADDPPALLLYDRSSQTVPTDQAIRLDRSLRAAGVESTLVLFEEPAGKPLLTQGSTAAVALVEFLDRVIAPGTRQAAPAAREAANPAP